MFARSWSWHECNIFRRDDTKAIKIERVTQNEVTQTEVVPLRRFLKRYFFTKKLFSNSFEFRELGTTPSSDAELGEGGGGGGEMVYKHYFQFLDSVDSASKKEPSSKYSNKFKF